MECWVHESYSHSSQLQIKFSCCHLVNHIRGWACSSIQEEHNPRAYCCPPCHPEPNHLLPLLQPNGSPSQQSEPAVCASRPQTTTFLILWTFNSTTAGTNLPVCGNRWHSYVQTEWWCPILKIPSTHKPLGAPWSWPGILLIPPSYSPLRSGFLSYAFHEYLVDM